MLHSTKKLGHDGEQLAAQFLLNKGYKIVAQNLVTKVGEVDILALDGTTTVVVEVKTKSNLAYGWPSEMITSAKLRKLRQLANWLKTRYNMKDYRIDVVSVLIVAGNPKIEHLIGIH